MRMGAWYARSRAALQLALPPARGGTAALPLLGALAALLPALVMWGFTVDDALIPLRYARHLEAGVGYRFNVHGPSTDGVTPLPWAFLLAPLVRASGGDLVAALDRAKAVGLFAATASGVALGRFLGKRAARRRDVVHAVAALVVVAVAYPIGAWAVSGMETGIATALATLATVSWGRPRRVAALAGLSAALRPELVVWAIALAAGAAACPDRAGAPALGESEVREDRSALARRVALAASVALAPFAICSLIRLAVYGRPAPLALMAKPSDAAHGLVYAASAAVVVLTPLLALAPLALRRAGPLAATLTVAALTHVLVVIAVGGDWMPYARLMVPIAPGLAIVHAEVARVSGVVASIRAASAVVLGVALAAAGAPAGRHVLGDRQALIARARPYLAEARTIAALDIGWVGAATDADIVDLAGLTDPSIASLPGGHTSKAVDVGMLLDRAVDVVLVYRDPALPGRVVEARLTRSPLFLERFVHVGDVPLGTRGAAYAVWRRAHTTSITGAAPK